MKKIDIGGEDYEDSLNAGDENHYIAMEKAKTHFLAHMDKFWNSLAFPKVVDKNPAITNQLLKVARLSDSIDFPDTLLDIRSKLKIVSQFDPLRKENANIVSINGGYAAVTVKLYSNGVEHNQHSVSFDMDEMEFIYDYS